MLILKRSEGRCNGKGDEVKRRVKTFPGQADNGESGFGSLLLRGDNATVKEGTTDACVPVSSKLFHHYSHKAVDSSHSSCSSILELDIRLSSAALSSILQIQQAGGALTPRSRPDTCGI